MPDHFLVVVVGFMTLKFLVVGVSQWARVDLIHFCFADFHSK